MNARPVGEVKTVYIRPMAVGKSAYIKTNKGRMFLGVFASKAEALAYAGAIFKARKGEQMRVESLRAPCGLYGGVSYA